MCNPPLVLREPVRGVIRGKEFLELSGIERSRAVLEGKLPLSPVSRLTGLHPTEVGLGMATFAMPATPWWQTGSAQFPAGCMAFVADAALSAAVMTAAPAGTAMTTSEMAMDFLRPATIRSGVVIARARLIHSTRSLGLAEVAVQDARGRSLAHGTSRCVLFSVDMSSLAEGKPVEEIKTELKNDPDPYLHEVEGVVLTQADFDNRPGLEILRERMRNQTQPPLSRMFGFRVDVAKEGEVTMRMPASRWLVSGSGTIYGGAIAALAEYASSTAVATTIPPATAFAPMDLKVSFIRPGLPADGELTANARVVHRGRTIAIVNCEVHNPDGKLMAMTNESVLILPGRPWNRPVYVADEITGGEAAGQ